MSAFTSVLVGLCVCRLVPVDIACVCTAYGSCYPLVQKLEKKVIVPSFWGKLVSVLTLYIHNMEMTRNFYLYIDTNSGVSCKFLKEVILV